VLLLLLLLLLLARNMMIMTIQFSNRAIAGSMSNEAHVTRATAAAMTYNDTHVVQHLEVGSFITVTITILIPHLTPPGLCLLPRLPRQFAAGCLGQPAACSRQAHQDQFDHGDMSVTSDV
jgi:hypothetical protein